MAIPEGDPFALLATGRYVGEGFDEARLDTLLLALPVSWRGTLQQYAGRLNRLHPTKHEVRIYDYLDADVPVLARMIGILRIFRQFPRTFRAIPSQSCYTVVAGDEVVAVS